MSCHEVGGGGMSPSATVVCIILPRPKHTISWCEEKRRETTHATRQSEREDATVLSTSFSFDVASNDTTRGGKESHTSRFDPNHDEDDADASQTRNPSCLWHKDGMEIAWHGMDEREWRRERVHGMA